MTLTVQLYYSFRSPYSYLATPRLRALTREWDLAIEVKPVYPIAVRDPGFFTREPPAWVPYLGRDVRRVAEFLELPFSWPDPDPIVQDRSTRAIAAEQPYIGPITRLGVAAARRGPEAGIAFVDAVSGALWGGQVKEWHKPEVLGPVLAREGMDLAPLLAEIEADPEDFDAEITRNQAALEAAGHWGVPTMVFEGEPFFGQDRVELLLWRLGRAGLKPRA